MPLLLLLAIASATGVAGAFVAQRLLRRRPSPIPEGGEAIVRSRWASRLDPEEITGLILTVALAALLLGGVVLAALAVVVREGGALSGIDESVAEWGNRHASTFTHDALTVVTTLGETWVVVVVAGAVAAFDFSRRRNPWVPVFLVAVILGDKLLTEALKQLIDRARPTLEPVAATLGPSFPSGHSSTAAASWAAFALVATRWWGRRTWAALAGLAVGIAVAVATSRVLLDVHWLTDVIAGLALGWAWFAACAIGFGPRLLGAGFPEGSTTAHRV